MTDFTPDKLFSAEPFQLSFPPAGATCSRQSCRLPAADAVPSRERPFHEMSLPDIQKVVEIRRKDALFFLGERLRCCKRTLRHLSKVLLLDVCTFVPDCFHICAMLFRVVFIGEKLLSAALAKVFR
jgi:hypothetical protein